MSPASTITGTYASTIIVFVALATAPVSFVTVHLIT